MNDIPFAETQSFFASRTFDIFINSNKLTFPTHFVDSEFWKIFDFNFLAGGPFGNAQVENQEQVIILGRKACNEYFANGDKDFDKIIGQEIVMDKKHFKVIGVIDRVNNSFSFLKSSAYVPYTNMDSKDLERKGFNGMFNAVFLAKNASQTIKIKEELQKKSTIIPLPNPEVHDQLEYYPATYAERYAWKMLRGNDPTESYRKSIWILIFLLTLFFLLPTLNLINLNISRIMERSSEIGVRKAFGADSGNILFQFIFENIVLTLIGGIIGFVLAFFLLNTINGSDFLNGTQLQFNYKVFLYSLLICLLFGILSGFIPAYKMSRVHIVNALKNSQL